MTEADRVATWIEGYVRAWNSNDPDEIAALFTHDAEYSTEPYGPPWRGPDEIVAGWLEHKDEPGETTFEWRPVAIADEVAIIEGTTVYPTQTYSNLWVIRLGADGRCRQFVEWWMKHPQSPAG